MKTILALSGALALSACSSVPIQNSANEREYVCDRAYMARAEERARNAGIYLEWVNCPLIRRDRVKTVS